MGPQVQGDRVLPMEQQESVIVLLKHCQEMKNLVTRLRLVMLFLLFSCVTVSSEQKVTIEHTSTSSRRDNVSKAIRHATLKRPSIHLTSLESQDETHYGHIKWQATLGEKFYNSDERAIVIPKTGIYFVYVSIALSWNFEDTESLESLENEGTAIHRYLILQLHQWRHSYPTDDIMEAWSYIPNILCGPWNIYHGRVFDLEKGAQLKVWIGGDFKLVDTTRTYFGAYRL